MPTIGAYLATYAAVLAALLIVAYLIPAGIFHWLIIYSRYSPSIVAGRIQTRRHRPDGGLLERVGLSHLVDTGELPPHHGPAR